MSSVPLRAIAAQPETLVARVRHHGFKRFEIGMNVTENCEPHYDPRQTTEGQNVTTEARGRTNVLVREMIFCSRY